MGEDLTGLESSAPIKYSTVIFQLCSHCLFSYPSISENWVPLSIHPYIFIINSDENVKSPYDGRTVGSDGGRRGVQALWNKYKVIKN